MNAPPAESSSASLAAALQAALDGDINASSRISTAPHDDLVRAASQLPELFLSAEAVIHVLRAYINGEAREQDVKRWASFVRHGYGDDTGGRSIRPLDIAWQSDREDEIAEALTRIYELGEAVDGVISPDEAEYLLRSLQDGYPP